MNEDRAQAATVYEGELALCESHELPEVFGFNLDCESNISKIWINDHGVVCVKVEHL